jgi:hypothetical protein
MENQTESTPWLIAKVASVWAAVGVTSWSEAASFMAFLYTTWLMAAKFWKDILRPFCERRGWVAVKVARDGT